MVSESLAVAQEFALHGDWTRTRENVFLQNLLKKKTQSSSQRVYREIQLRLKTLTKAQLTLLLSSTYQDQIQLLFLAACKSYRFLTDFCTEVLRHKVLLFDFTLQSADFDRFIETKQESHPELEALTENSKKKIRQVTLRILMEVELLATTRDPAITQPLVSQAVREVVVREHPAWLRVFLMSDSDIKQQAGIYGGQ